MWHGEVLHGLVWGLTCKSTAVKVDRGRGVMAWVEIEQFAMSKVEKIKRLRKTGFK